jgi:hypothetical protein
VKEEEKLIPAPDHGVDFLNRTKSRIKKMDQLKKSRDFCLTTMSSMEDGGRKTGV